MAKREKDKIQLQVVNGLCGKAIAALNAAHHYLDAVAVTEATREVSMAKTKIDESLMWIERYHRGVIGDLLDEDC